MSKILLISICSSNLSVILRRTARFFKFYQQEEHGSGNEDEVDFDFPAVVTKPAARKKSPCRVAEQPRTISNTALAQSTAPLSTQVPAAAAIDRPATSAVEPSSAVPSAGASTIPVVGDSEYCACHCHRDTPECRSTGQHNRCGVFPAQHRQTICGGVDCWCIHHNTAGGQR